MLSASPRARFPPDVVSRLKHDQASSSDGDDIPGDNVSVTNYRLYITRTDLLRFPDANHVWVEEWSSKRTPETEVHGAQDARKGAELPSVHQVFAAR